VTSSTSSSDQSHRGWMILALSAVLVVAVNVAAGAMLSAADQPIDHLESLPVEDGVWLIGNSMMGTGVDPQSLAGATGEDVVFQEFGAHYSSVWYLIVRNALPQATAQPAVVVWGFRPHTDRIPPLRGVGSTTQPLFEVEGDALYDTLLERDLNDPWMGASVSGSMGDAFGELPLAREREDSRSSLTDLMIEISAALLDRLGADGMAIQLRDGVINGDLTLGDVATRLVTEGRVQFATELVDDLQGDFVRGEPQPFDATFLPEIARLLMEQGIAQVVIVHPQRNVAEGERLAVEDAFVDDAHDWFEARGIPVLDAYNDPEIVLADFGGGDHLNESGRTKVTAALAAILNGG